MKVMICQAIVSKDIATNFNKIIAAINASGEGDWIIFPEAMLSGYYPGENEYTSILDWELIQNSLDQIKQTTILRKCNCVVGSAYKVGNAWRNSCFVFSYGNPDYVHHKTKLSSLDKKHFVPGTAVNVGEYNGLKFGLLACRELIFPDLWQGLKKNGVAIIFHLNNAIQPHDKLWEHILISRAIENSIFVVSVNNAMKPQSLLSYVIDPTGKIICKSKAQLEENLICDLDMNLVIADLDQRSDY